MPAHLLRASIDTGPPFAHATNRCMHAYVFFFLPLNVSVFPPPTRAGRVVQHFDHSAEEGESEPTVAAVSPSGQSMVLGSCNRLRVYNFNVRRQKWDASPPKTIENLYTTSALAWKPDGSRLVVVRGGFPCGCVCVCVCVCVCLRVCLRGCAPCDRFTHACARAGQPVWRGGDV